MSFENKRILVGVCGSIAAFKACELVRVLMREGADVTVAMTGAAGYFGQRLILSLDQREWCTQILATGIVESADKACRGAGRGGGLCLKLMGTNWFKKKQRDLPFNREQRANQTQIKIYQVLI